MITVTNKKYSSLASNRTIRSWACKRSFTQMKPWPPFVKKWALTSRNRTMDSIHYSAKREILSRSGSRWLRCRHASKFQPFRVFYLSYDTSRISTPRSQINQFTCKSSPSQQSSTYRCNQSYRIIRHLLQALTLLTSHLAYFELWSTHIDLRSSPLLLFDALAVSFLHVIKCTVLYAVRSTC